ncbi:Uncharacterised protein [Klebsiella variicola]|uniref:hypothetical protein n=1 Tax=Klebsiella variicola TaxID=244366 RepID=UPI000D74867E|nr:hypothetical protein [Klebsiella variicola]PXH26314.1 hypothetical protein DMR13_24545 [Klebsiella variicola]SXD64689.1 Uncharacterised protein [Klebsiella variicola]
MLENYYGIDYTDDEKKRLLAVQAAIEIAIASVSANTADSNNLKTLWDLKHVAQEIGALADSIQAALK